LHVGVHLSTISFRDALDKAATLLDADGFTIEEVKQCAFAGIEGQTGSAVFQVLVRVSYTQARF
jgi:hypothetical protein